MKTISQLPKIKLTSFFLFFSFVIILFSCSDSESDTWAEEAMTKNTVSAYKVYAEEALTTSKTYSDKRWSNGSVIKIKFLNGSATAQEKVKEISEEWTKHAKLQFVFVKADEIADVKVAFSWNGDNVNWAYIGLDNKKIAQNTPSMNLALISGDEAEINSDIFKANILRSFGHVLGLIFENEGMEQANTYDEEKLRDYLKLMNWSEDDIDRLILQYETKTTNFESFDSSSIMLLQIPDFLTLEKVEETPTSNSKLSSADKALVASWYHRMPTTLELKFSMDGGKTNYPYKAVLIGEYYWIDNNFNHPVPKQGDIFNAGGEAFTPISKAMLDTYMKAIHMDLSNKEVENFPKHVYELANFNKYYGVYYNRASINYMTENGTVYEDNKENKTWELPSNTDYRQLFAMCDVGEDKVLTNNDIQVALAARYGDNPVAVPYYVEKHDKLIFGENKDLNVCRDAHGPSLHAVYWNSFDLSGRPVENKYGFNLMAGGARGNGSGTWRNSLYDIEESKKDQLVYDHKGENQYLYHLFYTVAFHTKEGAMNIHDYIQSYDYIGYHWFNARWCRRLSDKELGYKLYINDKQTDIIKLSLAETAPENYHELENGYLRGFYVQYILDQAYPQYTIADIVSLSKQVDDFSLKGR